MYEEEKAASNGLSLAALVFGILTMLLSCTIVVPAVTAPLAITFAWLSRGKKRMCTQAVTGHVLAVIGICISLIVCVLLLAALIRCFQGLTVFGTGLLGPMLEDLFNYGV